MDQIINEIDSKKSMVKMLREDLTKTEATLMKTQGRESELEDQLDVAKKEVKKLTLELNKSTGDFLSNTIRSDFNLCFYIFEYIMLQNFAILVNQFFV